MNPTRSLSNLSGPGKLLKSEPPDPVEFAGLCRTGCARWVDAQNHDLSIESRFDLAYNAAHALSLAALRKMGFRPSHRDVAFQVWPHTLGLSPEVWRVLDLCHAKRNMGEYEGWLDVDERLLSDLIAAVHRIEEALLKA